MKRIGTHELPFSALNLSKEDSLVAGFQAINKQQSVPQYMAKDRAPALAGDLRRPYRFELCYAAWEGEVDTFECLEFDVPYRTEFSFVCYKCTCKYSFICPRAMGVQKRTVASCPHHSHILYKEMSLLSAPFLLAVSLDVDGCCAFYKRLET